MRKLLLNDYHKIKKYLDDANYEGYNSNFVTMMMWDHEYEIYYEIKDNFMVMLHTYLDEKFFAMPFCKQSTTMKQSNICKTMLKSITFFLESI